MLYTRNQNLKWIEWRLPVENETWIFVPPFSLNWRDEFWMLILLGSMGLATPCWASCELIRNPGSVCHSTVQHQPWYVCCCWLPSMECLASLRISGFLEDIRCERSKVFGHQVLWFQGPIPPSSMDMVDKDGRWMPNLSNNFHGFCKHGAT